MPNFVMASWQPTFVFLYTSLFKYKNNVKNNEYLPS